MKPRTKFQKFVAAVNDKLPEFPAKAACWAYDNRIGHRAFRNPKSGRTVCLDCGTVFTAATAGRLVCPGCHRLTEVVDSYKRTHKESCYFSVAGVKDGLQYIRVSRLDVGFHTGQLAHRRLTEVCRLWMDSTGQTAVTSRKGTCGLYIDSFDLGSPIELRAMKNVHRMIADMNLCPAYRVIPELRRRGVRGKLPHLPLFSLLSGVMNDSRVETLLKARRTDELDYFLNRGRDLDKYWPSLRIAIRHGHVIGDIGLWADMLAAMMALGADVRNPALICPPDLPEAHDR